VTTDSFAARAAGVLRLDPDTVADIARAAPSDRRQAIAVVLVAGLLRGLEANGPTMLRVASRDGIAGNTFLLAGVAIWAVGVLFTLGIWTFLAGATRLVADRVFGLATTDAMAAGIHPATAWAFLPWWFIVLASVAAIQPWLGVIVWVWSGAIFVAAVRAALDVPLRRAIAITAVVGAIALAGLLILVGIVAALSRFQAGSG
jgi:hypothetical protein